MKTNACNNPLEIRSSSDGTTTVILFDGRNIKEEASFFAKLRTNEAKLTFRTNRSMLYRVDEAELRCGILRLLINPLTIDIDIKKCIINELYSIIKEHYNDFDENLDHDFYDD